MYYITGVLVYIILFIMLKGAHKCGKTASYTIKCMKDIKY